MIDTIGFHLNLTVDEYKCFEAQFDEGASRNSYRIAGTIDGMHVFLKYDGTMLVYMSLAKMEKGINADSLHIDQIKSGIDDLLYKYPSFKKAQLHRIDIAAVTLMDSPLWAYYRHLGYKKHWRKVVDYYGPPQVKYRRIFNDHDHETRLYSGRRMSLSFYNKLKELEKTHGSWSEGTEETINLLKYEMQLKKELRTQLGLSQDYDLSLESLYDPQLLRKLVQKWYDEYASIQKIRRFTHVPRLEDPREIKKMLVAIGYDAAGPLEIDRMLKDYYLAGLLPKSTYHSLKSDLHKGYKRYVGNESIGTLDEMNRKIKAVYTSYMTAIDRFEMANSSSEMAPSTHE